MNTQQAKPTAGPIPITPEDVIQTADRLYDLGRKHGKEEMQPQIDAQDTQLRKALECLQSLQLSARLTGLERESIVARCEYIRATLGELPFASRTIPAAIQSATGGKV